MKVIFHRRCQKFIQKITDKKLKGILKEEVDAIISDPLKGKLLEHPFRKYEIRSGGFDYKGNSYRIAYTMVKEKKEIVFLVIDSRENFYEKLKNATK